MIHLCHFTPTMPQFISNNKTVSGHPSQRIIGDIEKESALFSLFFFLLTFESSLGSEMDGKIPYPYDCRSITVSVSRGKREVEESRYKIPPFEQSTNGHWFLVLASVSGYSQTHQTRKRVLIVRQKRNLGDQNVRRKQTNRQTPIVIADGRARYLYSRWIQYRSFALTNV